MEKGKRKNSIFIRIFIPALLLLIMQAVVLQVLMYAFNVYGNLTENAYDVLNERVIGRKNELNTFLHTGVNLASTEQYLSELYDDYATEESSPSLFESDAVKNDFLFAASDQLISTMRRNKVNGIFLVLNETNTNTEGQLDGDINRSGLAIRDFDAGSSYINNEDLVIVRGTRTLVSALGISLDSTHKQQFTLNSAAESNAYYFNPLKAATQSPEYSYDNLAYFQGLHRLGDSSTEVSVVSYSVPLVSSTGDIIGVLGIEIMEETLKSLMPYSELGDKRRSTYALVQKKENESEYIVEMFNGSYFETDLQSPDKLTASKQIKKDCYEFEIDRKNVSGSTAMLGIYNNNAFYSKESTYIIGLVDRDDLLAFGNKIQINIIISLAISVVAGVVFLVIVIRRIVSPITKLYEKVRTVDNPTELSFEKTKITEIDRLTESIEQLGKKVTSNRAKNEFFSRMSHDMRTPMNAIIGLSSKELTQKATDKQKLDYLHQINESGKYLLGLINDILDINKLESERVELVCKPISLGEVWGMVVPIISEVAAQKEITFLNNLDFIDTKLVVSMDVKRFSQIFINLLSNAVKFTSAGGTVELNISLSITDGVVAQKVLIRDTGRGMSNEFQHIIYEQFSQENPEKEGTGLGLSIAKSLVDLMHGTISFRSEKGKGTEFTVIIPSKIINTDSYEMQSTRTKHIDKNGDSANVFDGKRILVCEDNDINAEIAIELLSIKNVACEHAENGRIGLEMFSESPIGYYSAILMDMRMPEMDGLAATKAIRELPRADAKTVGIIAMTANAFDSDIDACLNAGMNAHLAKPVDPMVFYEVIGSELYKK